MESPAAAHGAAGSGTAGEAQDRAPLGWEPTPAPAAPTEQDTARQCGLTKADGPTQTHKLLTNRLKKSQIFRCLLSIAFLVPQGLLCTVKHPYFQVLCVHPVPHSFHRGRDIELGGMVYIPQSFHISFRLLSLIQVTMAPQTLSPQFLHTLCTPQ